MNINSAKLEAEIVEIPDVQSIYPVNEILPSNIPAAKGFIGREDELSVLQEAKLNGKTSFVLHGIGGSGKTALAMKFIEEIKNEFQTHIRIDMQGSASALSPENAMLEVIRAFRPDAPNLPPEQIENLYISLLNQYKTLLFLDDAESREQVEPLTRAGGFVIITSRSIFNVIGGFSFGVGLMPSRDAVQLLHSIAGEERFEGKADQVAQLAGYLPIALLPLAYILAEDATEDVVSLIKKYSDRKMRLELADPNKNGEMLSVEASFDLSYERLNEELKERWRKLAVFPAEFDLEAVKAIWKDENSKEIISALVKTYFIFFNLEKRRFVLHPLAREYAYSKLNPLELFEAEKLHAIHYGEFLSKLEGTEPDFLDLFDLERINIECGFEWIKKNLDKDPAVPTVCLLYTGYAIDILQLRLHPREFIKWMGVGILASQKVGHKKSEIDQLLYMAIAYMNLGEYNKAIECNQKALEISAEINDLHSKTISLSNLGAAYGYAGAYEKSIAFNEQALRISQDLNDQKGEGQQLGSIGNSYLSLGEYQRAVEYYIRALAILRETGDRRSEGNNLSNLGSAYLRLGEYQKALEYYERALAILREIGDRRGEGSYLGNLGNAYLRLGEYEKANEYFSYALAIALETGDRQNEGMWLGNLGNIYSKLAEYRKAIEYHERALIIAREVGDRQSEGNWLGNLGSAYAILGEKEKAADLWEEAVRILEEIKSAQAEIFRQYLAEAETK